ncbi:glycosyltransferase [Clostridium sp. SHJSY1]|uniref:glycosyltransferase family 2 protein n=1 Tax=Clostridium sp. SHJSY1 TaxID=2942483 RepID=UPI002875CB51|nr:glycosyltransferase family 2 protein [Clostridium sp. SHJSY1]MDS0525433.1 glycosyltransferase [Clostridium sp. SHJSY1]
MKDVKEKKETLKNKITVFLAVLTGIIYFSWRIFFTLPFEYGIVSMIAGVILLISEIVAIFEAIELYRNAQKRVLPEKPTIPDEWYPEVDVFIATHNESRDLLFKTINGCMNMDYPDKSKVHIAICDDSDRPEIKELADQMGVGYFGLSNNKHAKAGNLNNAISKTSAPLITTLDADMIPTHRFLMEAVPYFFLPRLKKVGDKWVERTKDEIDKDYRIGFIQTPQSFYNPDLFQYNLYSEGRIPNEQDYFFREINVMRNSNNAPIYAGSNTVISRQALVEVGGIATGTITEDFETGLSIQNKGYTTYAIPTVVAHGLSPDTITSLINQRERWGRGCVQSLKKMKILTRKDIPWSLKISYIASLIYWWSFVRRFVYIISPLLFVLFDLHIVECSFWQIICIWLPSYVLYNKVLNQISGNIRNNRWSNIMDTVIFPYMILPILLETVGVSQKKFVVTRKDRILSETKTNFNLAVPHMILAGASILALFIMMKDLILYQTIQGTIIIYWLIVNLYNLIMSVFFMIGRTNYRESERYIAELDAEVTIRGKMYKGVTKDISEGGLAITLSKPYYFSKDERIMINVSSDRYKASFVANVTHVRNDKNNWIYSFNIIELDFENKKQYFQLIYDRDHSLPKYIDDTLSVFDDLYLNLQKRINISEQSQRSYPRIELNIEMMTKDKIPVFAIDFNYEYILLKNMRRGEKLPNEIILMCGSNIEMKCKKIRQLSRHKECYLYQVENSFEIYDSEEFQALLG